VPEAVRFDELQVVMVKGVGVGLLTFSSSQTESRSPAEWTRLLDAGTPGQ
jgi:hypothetical protein